MISAKWSAFHAARRVEACGCARIRRVKPDTSISRMKGRNVFFVLVGVAALLLKGHYSGPYQESVRSYGGNVAASFAVYFVVSHLRFHSKSRRWVTAGVALAVVELFEAGNGFGVMTNVYDRVDFAANAVGIALALAIDCVTPGDQRSTTYEGE